MYIIRLITHEGQTATERSPIVSLLHIVVTWPTRTFHTFSKYSQRE